MKIRFVILWFFFLFLGGRPIILKADTIVLSEHQQSYVLGEYAWVYEDKTGELTLEDIVSESYITKFTPSQQKNLSFGYSESTIWVKVQLQNLFPARDDWLFEIGYPVLDEVTFYYKDDYGSWYPVELGDHRPFHQRPMAHRNFIVPLDISDMELKTYYIKCKSRTTLKLPMKLYFGHFFHEQEVRSEMLHGIFYGLMGVMVFYNLFIFFALRDINYLHYVISIFASTLYFTAKSGHAYQYLWPNSIWLGDHFILLTIGAWASTSAIFTQKFLHTKNYSVILSRLLDAINICGALVIVGTFFLDYTIVAIFGTYLLLSETIIILAVAGVCWVKGNKAARYFVLAWSIYMTGTLLLALQTFALVPNNFLTDNAAEIGAALEVILLSLALSDKYALLRKEKEKAQEQLMEAKDDALMLLESKVQERTAELSQRNEEIEAQNEQLRDLNYAFQKQNEHISSSLNYAKRIQHVMLPDRTKIAQAFSESFILFRPRDVVSGDFYWMVESETKTLIAAVDCTGHGVPGSFMSMLGNSILSEIVTVRGIDSPELILDLLHLGVRQTLKQDTTQNRDGMDLALCAVTPSKKLIEFSGAKNPLIYVKNGELQTIKGDKMPIGGRQRENERKFTKHEISYQDAPIVIYLFSDGYQDQFGGEQGRKFMIKRFRKLLLDLHTQSFPVQKRHLEDTFDKWRNGTRQIDDVLVIGLKLQ